ncbi:PHD finger protein At1g33420-like isoform X1 [Salvia splendens]|uniref:PHD finger protein At1g33420-like isoform X1 n=1 Tax=Salvia splendens TaxID=180675 RepID=UPI001C255BC0|nr:PHD finger protein At1g33420-like isoform X1 [Salvia splendens]
MVVNGRPTKRLVKRRVTADLSDFLTFPSAGDLESPAAARPFRTTVRAFLTQHAILPPPSSLFPHLLTWQILFRVGDLAVDDGGPAIVCLDVVEEDVARSRSVYCDQCRVVGWSSNPVSGKRYHFIIKADGNSIAGYNKTCAGCGDALHMTDSRCKSCNHVMTTEDVEDWMYQQLDNTTHLLHGVIHANGYGHLLRVNGREGGSRLLSGRHIMNFWDRLCKLLGVRKVSVMDVSKKNCLEFRLLHAVVNGHPWYGDWGYHFGAGSFSLNLDDYKMAIENLSSLPLSLFQAQGRKARTRLQDLISFYQSISERELVNIRDLFSFLMGMIHDRRQFSAREDESPRKKLKTSYSRALCSWTIDDVRRVEEAMFKVLRAVSGSTWVSWRALKGAVCRVGSPELLDYCLKELKGKQAATGMVVAARCISDTGAMEYRLEPGSASIPASTCLNTFPMANQPSHERLVGDLKYFYDCLLQPEAMVLHVPVAKRDVAVSSVMKILDCKQFVKDYLPGHFLPVSKENTVQVLCEVDLMEQPEEYKNHNPPPELLVLSPDATIADLKVEAMKAFQDVYLMMRRFQAEEVVGYGGVDESTQIRLLLGSMESVRIRGKFHGKNGLSRYRMERGLERWIVDCLCGAKDDDGERMLACDVCGIWQHTRCSGIPDSDGAPVKFCCHRCRGRGMSKGNGQCREQVVDNVFVDVAAAMSTGVI